MRRLCLILVLLTLVGCVSEGGKGFFDDAVRDWNGENQRMRSGDVGELPAPTLGPSRR